MPLEMSLRSQVHLLVDAITLPIHISRENPGHLVVVTFIRQNKRTDVEIEFHQIEGGGEQCCAEFTASVCAFCALM